MTDSKKSRYIALSIVGIILQTIILDLNIGPVLLSPVNFLGLILSIAGLIPLKKEQNRLFARRLPLLYTAVMIHFLVAYLSTGVSGAHAKTLILTFNSILAIILLNFAYGFTEALTLQAKFLKMEVDMPHLRSAFFTFCIFVALAVVADNYDVLIVTLIAKFISYASALYFANSLNILRNKLYPPVKTQDLD